MPHQPREGEGRLLGGEQVGLRIKDELVSWWNAVSCRDRLNPKIRRWVYVLDLGGSQGLRQHVSVHACSCDKRPETSLLEQERSITLSLSVGPQLADSAFLGLC